jgi:hypothetical protein
MYSKNYNKLVDLFLELKQLGHFDEENRLICLYDILNEPKIILGIKNEIEKITKKYKLVVLEKEDTYTNINILDIEV